MMDPAEIAESADIILTKTKKTPSEDLKLF